MDQSFHPVFLPGAAGKFVMLLLHGTGGDERDLIPLGQAVAPDAAILSVRGKVDENGMPRFFRRHAEGIFDQEDLAFRTDELADFIAEARRDPRIANRKMIALGFSNGANIAASLLLKKPAALDGAVLLRAMVPFAASDGPSLAGRPVLMINGLMDPVIPVDNAETLAAMFRDRGGAVDARIKLAGHALTSGEITDIQAWLAAL